MLRRRFEGTVVVRVEIDRLGKLVALHLVEGTGRKEWDDSLLAAMKEAEFQPARKADLPVACRHTFRIKFEQN
jgi:TonB family protein